MSETALTYSVAMDQMLSAGDVSNTTRILTTTGGDYTTWTSPCLTYYWPSYSIDKTGQALRIVKVLMDNKTIKVTSIKKFIDLVDEIARVL